MYNETFFYSLKISVYCIARFHNVEYPMLQMLDEMNVQFKFQMFQMLDGMKVQFKFPMYQVLDGINVQVRFPLYRD